jgi:hypothetical protein
VWYVAWKLVLCEVKFIRDLVGIKTPKPESVPVVTQGTFDRCICICMGPAITRLKSVSDERAQTALCEVVGYAGPAPPKRYIRRRPG